MEDSVCVLFPLFRAAYVRFPLMFFLNLNIRPCAWLMANAAKGCMNAMHDHVLEGKCNAMS
jgi:hypothetical protein